MALSADHTVAPASSESHPSSEVLLASYPTLDGLLRTDISVPGMHCANCIRTVERALSGLDGVRSARVNLSTQRATVHWQAETPPPMLETLQELGYQARLYEAAQQGTDQELRQLVKALAVAGFCTLNIMLFSVSVWAGAEGEIRNLFHWISAALAAPAVFYSGRPFFLSAWRAVSHGRTNMDVPISVGVLVAFGLSLYDTVLHSEHAYFDAAVTLLFFLLAGRTLDRLMRDRARGAVATLAKLVPRGATTVDQAGQYRFIPTSSITPEMVLRILPGDRFPVDCMVTSGTSDVDVSIINGEAMPVRAELGAVFAAGSLNLSGTLLVRATAATEGSFVAQMLRLIEGAEVGRNGYRRIADRAAALYAPVVHCAALLTLAGWFIAGAGWHAAINTAVAVLIITCPCALGLAVPIVQVVASRKLFEEGVVSKDGSALERLAEADTVVLDKTGTITSGLPRLANSSQIPLEHWAIAAAMAMRSRHPVARAIVSSRPPPIPSIELLSIEEYPGDGISARRGSTEYRLGRAQWALDDHTIPAGTVLAANGQLLARFWLSETIRPDAPEVIAELRRSGLSIEMLSGDHPAAVEAAAKALGVTEWRSMSTPVDKLQRLEELAGRGRKVLMVGDGLNDAPALAGAHVSIAPCEAAEVGQKAADIVLLRPDLRGILTALRVARASKARIRENLAFALAYNAVAVPVAIFGYVTPLVAAVAMSSSSVLVVANSLRLLRSSRRATSQPATTSSLEQLT